MTARKSRDDYRVVSADAHVLEPPDLWTARVAAAERDRVPRLERLPQGPAWLVEGSGPLPLEPLPSDDLPPERWGDPAHRLTVLDADGLDAEVLFPNRPFRAVVAQRDPALHLAMVRAYNDWLSGFCAHAPDRLGGVAAVPNRGVADAVAEVERAAELPGVVAFLLACYPHGDTAIDRGDDPVWAAVEASGKPLAIHVMLTDGLPADGAATLPGTDRFFDAPGRMLELVFSGMLDRFPDLEVVFAEVDCGWVPYFVDQADDNYLRHANATLKDDKLPRVPSDYVRDRFSFTFVHDTYAIANRHRIGVDRMMWSSNFPQPATDWPFSWKSINAQLADVPKDERRQIVAGNALRLFGFGT